MQNPTWAVACNFFSVSHADYLHYKEICPSKLWKVLCDLKKWTQEDLENNKREMEREFQAFLPEHCIEWGDLLYPKAFESLVQPPACLYYQGDLNILHEQSLSVVGSRLAAICFLDWMDVELGAFLSRNPMAIISGGARGIDQKATQVALRHGQKSVIVLPSGFNSLYPSELAFWKNHRDILFLSEYLPQQKMRKHHFVRRNRLVSALSPCLLVVQCASKSGSMITVRYALEQGKQVATVPDFPGAYESSGNLQLLKEGAALVTSAQDLLDFTNW